MIGGRYVCAVYTEEISVRAINPPRRVAHDLCNGIFWRRAADDEK
jgi:hypothetical protein